MSADHDHSGKQMHITDFLDKETIQALMEQFHEATHLLTAILDLEGGIIVGAGWQDICTNFHRANPKSRTMCLESDPELTNGIPKGEYRIHK
ncbi:MAG: PocR ligand-binding domain-containing protein, partial [Synergistota bacterium]|nr:PocR ligand-binding domain-containing protein [Synergistota bacterium]